MSGATEETARPRPRRRRALEALISFGCLLAWMTGLVLLAAYGGAEAETSAIAGVGMIGLYALAWGAAELLVRGAGMAGPGAMLGLVGSVCLGYGLTLIDRLAQALPTEQWITMICGGAAAGMMLFLFRLRLAVLVSPIITFSVVALYLGIRGATPEAIARVEGFSPRAILAALISEPAHMAAFGLLAVAMLAFARWLDLYAQEFGMRSAKPLHIVGAGVAALVAGRLAAELPAPAALATFALLFAASMAWALRVDRLAVMATGFFVLAQPLILTLLALAGGTMDARDWIVAHMGVLGVGFFLWPVLRKRTVAAGYTRKPRHITWNWPDRVIWPYRPPPGHR